MSCLDICLEILRKATKTSVRIISGPIIELGTARIRRNVNKEE
jgi:hypothetical protein